MNFSYKRLAVALGVVVALLVGGKMYVDHAEQVALEKEIQAFAAKVGRSPHPEEVNRGITRPEHCSEAEPTRADYVPASSRGRMSTPETKMAGRRCTMR